MHLSVNYNSDTPSRWKAALCAVPVYLCLGSVFAWASLVGPLAKLPGWEREALAWSYSISFIMMGLGARFRRKVASQSLFSAGLFLGFGLMGAGVAIHLNWYWLFLFFFSGLGGIGLGMGIIAPFQVLMEHFPRRRGLACGIPVFGLGVGALLLPLLLTELISLIGVPFALWFLGAIDLVVITGFAHAFSYPDDSSLPERKMNDILKSWPIWTLAIVFLAHLYCGNTVMATAVATGYQSAFPTQSGMLALGWSMVINGFAGCFLWPLIADLTNRCKTLVVIILLEALLFAALPHVFMPPIYMFSACLLASCFGGGMALFPSILRDLYGRSGMPIAFAAILPAWGVAALYVPKHSSLEQHMTAHGIIMAALALAFVLAVVVCIFAKKCAD
jgi:MFS transporter, OFA family, oxalate/formate antiporter